MAPAGLFVSQRTGSHSSGISRIVLSVCGCAWYTVRNLLCIVTTDPVLENSKTQNAFLFPVHAMFLHNCPLAVKPASTLRRLVHKKKILWEILYLYICSFLLCLSWLLCSRVRNCRRGLWITLYNTIYTPNCLEQDASRNTEIARKVCLLVPSSFRQMAWHL
jgi:hypothetical protein